MIRLSRLMAPAAVAVAFAVAAPAAHAGTITFPARGTTVTITDPGSASNSVHLTVTVADPAKLADTKVYLGASQPWYVIGLNGIREAQYDGNGNVAPANCSVYGSTDLFDVPVIPGGATSFSADLPKGELISFADIDVAVGVVGVDTPCDAAGLAGLAINYVGSTQELDGFSWDLPAAPAVSATGGRRQVALSFDQDRGTQYDIYRVVDGVRTSYESNVRGNGDDVQVVIDENPDHSPLDPGTAYTFQVQATRLFMPDRMTDEYLVGPFSALTTVTTAAVQTLAFTAAPAASTTARSAQFSWTMSANDAGQAPFCVLDPTETSGTEVPCTATGATVAGLSVGAHTLNVYPADGEGTYTHSWTVADLPTTPPPAPVNPPTPTTPVNPIDLDGDGIDNGWLIGGKPAPAPRAPKARVTGNSVKLALAAAPKGAKKTRIYRADGKGRYTLVTTLAPKSKSFTDKKVKPGHTYKYKVVAVNAKGQQGQASKAVTAKTKKKK